MSLEELRKGKYVMDEKQWLTVRSRLVVQLPYGLMISPSQRFLFLESIAGVPGMVAATLRHLKSIRLMVCLTRSHCRCALLY